MLVHIVLLYWPPLDEAIAGKQSQDDTVWSEHLTDDFKATQAAVASS